jgi:hypothetical protein
MVSSMAWCVAWADQLYMRTHGVHCMAVQVIRLQAALNEKDMEMIELREQHMQLAVSPKPDRPGGAGSAHCHLGSKWVCRRACPRKDGVDMAASTTPPAIMPRHPCA